MAVVLLPSTQGDVTQQIIVSKLGADWATSTLNTSTFSGGPQIVFSEADVTLPETSLNHPADEDGIPDAEAQASWDFGFFTLPVFPQHTVTATKEWAAYLDPSIPSLNTTLFHHLMTSKITSIKVTTNVKIILAGLLANGLSGIRSISKLQGIMRTVLGTGGTRSVDGNYWFSGKGNIYQVDASDSKNWVKFHVSSVFQGYADNTRSTIPKFAITLLLLYCAFAIAHVLYAGIPGISSTCWDSIAEVTALAVNLPPTKALRNTCAGITEFDIFKLPVRILAMRDDEGDGEHLEQVFGNVDEKSVEHRIIKPNRTYGTLPSRKPREKIL